MAIPSGHRLLEAEAGKTALAGRAEEALRLQQEAVALAPLSAPGHHNLALLLAGLGRAEEARAEVRRALEINPELAAARRLEELLAAPACNRSLNCCAPRMRGSIRSAASRWDSARSSCPCRFSAIARSKCTAGVSTSADSVRGGRSPVNPLRAFR